MCVDVRLVVASDVVLDVADESSNHIDKGRPPDEGTLINAAVVTQKL